ncbi:MAG: flagellar biosynthesis protein FlhF [Nitrospirota bacterium]
MRIKTFEAAEISEALKAVKAEMGPDAVILSTREVKKENGVLGLFGHSVAEVVAATDLSPKESAMLMAPSPILPAPSRAQVSPVSVEKDHRGAQIERGKENGQDKRSFQHLLKGLGAEKGVTLPMDKGVLEKLYDEAVGSGLDEQTVSHLFDLARKKMEWDKPPTEAFLKEYIRKIISEWVLKFTNPAAISAADPIIAFVGPTGVGKTTTLVKIAARLCQQKKKVILSTLDTYRVGAVEQLRSYSQILGVPLRVVASGDALIDLCEEVQKMRRGKGDEGTYLLIDTAGRSPYNDAQIDQLKVLAYTTIQVHLVLSAGTRGSDLDDIIAHFSSVPINRLIFTKLDETKRYGHLFSAIRKNAIKPSYFTMGQRVPEDMEETTPDVISRWVLP